MSQTPYGTNIPFKFQSAQHAQVVIETAITVWMKMGLTQTQIEYGIAMMNVESGFSPVIKTLSLTDTIRGLGQFYAATWNGTAEAFDLQYGLQMQPPVPSTPNPLWNPTFAAGLNAPVGESNDSAAGYYDPDGLVAQLEVVGEGIQQEWLQAQSPGDEDAAQELVDLGAKNASLLVPSATNSQLMATIALAYLNHHEGSPWSSQSKVKGKTHVMWTAIHLNDPKTGLATALSQVLKGVADEQNWIEAHVANPTGTGAGLLLAGVDPWSVAGAVPSTSDNPLAPILISHDIPSIFPTIDNFYSQTAGGLTSFVVTNDTHGPANNPRTDYVSYTFTTAGTQPLDVSSGTTYFNFDSEAGGGTENFVNGDTLRYVFISGFSGYSLQSTQYDASGSAIATETEKLSRF